MFRLFNDIPTHFSTNAIQSGQYLEHATTSNTNLFFGKKVMHTDLPTWQLLYLEGKSLYWGKVQNNQVAKACFFEVDINELQQEFATVDANNDHYCLNALRQYILADIDLIDGAHYQLIDLDYESLSITLLSSWEFILAATVIRTSMSANTSESIEEVVPYRVIINPIDFSAIQTRML